MKKSGCYRDRIFDIRLDPVVNDIIWRERQISENFKNSLQDELVTQEEMDELIQEERKIAFLDDSM